MKLPGAAEAIVDDAKVRDYLLSAEHPVGRFKARVFTAAGYTRADWRRLQADLRRAATDMDVEPSTALAFGQRFVGTTRLVSPSDQPLPIVIVWFIRSAEATPRLVTAYPGRNP